MGDGLSTRRNARPGVFRSWDLTGTGSRVCLPGIDFPFMTAEEKYTQRVADKLAAVLSVQFGIGLSPSMALQAAKAITEGDNVCGSKKFYPREIWEQDNYQTHIRREGPLHLLQEVFEKGFVPVGPITETISRQNSYAPDGFGVDVLEDSDDWDSVVVRLLVKVWQIDV